MRKRHPPHRWRRAALIGYTGHMAGALRPGQKIRVTHRVRVGQREWERTVVGTFLERGRRPTGIHTDRVPEDDIWVETILMEKDNGERSVIVLDEFTRVEEI